LKILQSEAARRLDVSTVTLSRWERDTVYPTWAVQPRVIDYLGYDPFTNAELGRPKGNETPFVAILAPNEPVPLGLAIWKRRMELKKTRKQCAKELGVAAKTLQGWEMGRRTPCPRLKERILKILKSEGSKSKLPTLKHPSRKTISLP
jgi:transcriptional regulator with XRE-family HTH domain